MAQYPLWRAAALAALCGQLHILALFLPKARGGGWYAAAPLFTLSACRTTGPAMSNYQAFETLREHKARLHGSVLLGTGVELAAWSNCNDRVTQESADHHTLSLYVADGYECYQQVPGGWRNGGGPDRFCIMPRQYASTWDVRSDLSFVHLYCTDGHLRQLAEQTWDRSPAAINVEPRSFGEDPQITLLYRQFLLNCDWRDSANLLALSSASNLLMSHLIQRYSQLQWKRRRRAAAWCLRWPGGCGNISKTTSIGLCCWRIWRRRPG